MALLLSRRVHKHRVMQLIITIIYGVAVIFRSGRG
ncbi:MAG: hypothetical protein RIT35_93 [Pseudomonadota bacterium]